MDELLNYESLLNAHREPREARECLNPEITKCTL